MGTVRPLVFVLAGATGACAALIGVRDDVSFADDAGADGAGADGASPLDANPTDAGRGDAAGGDAAQAGDAGDAGDAGSSACVVTHAPAMTCASSCDTRLVPGPAAVGIDAYTFGIAVDASNVYWVTQDNVDGNGNAAIHRASKSDGTSATTIATASGTTSLAVDDTYVYWFANTGGGTQLFRVVKNAAGCGAACPPTAAFTPSIGGISQSTTMALGGGGVLGIGDRAIFRASPAATQISDAYPSFVVWQDRVFWMTSPLDHSSSTLQSAPLDLSSATTAKAPSFPAKFIATDCKSIFGSIFDPTYGIERWDPASPGAGWAILTSQHSNDPADQVYALAADDTFVYVGYAGDQGIDRVAIADGTIAPLVTAVTPRPSVYGIALDDAYVYYGDHGTGTRLAGAIWRHRK